MSVRSLISRILVMSLCLAVFLSFWGCVADIPAETTDGTSSETSPETEPDESLHTTAPTETTPAAALGNIYLYGEDHGEEEILALELERWQKHYHEDGMRHLFIEVGWFSAAYLNLWMQADDNTILYQIFEDWEGTAGGTTVSMDFYREIKRTCPETVFHGTDIGHQYWSTGSRYLDELEEQGLENSSQYALAQEAMEQGRAYYGSTERDEVYRENTMTENFIREFEALNGESVMGIYGSAHINLDGLNHSGQCDSMGKQLKARYGDQISSEDLTLLVLSTKEPQRTETLEIARKSYTAEYYGKENLSSVFPEYSHREFWHLVDAGEDFAQWTMTGNVLPQSNYPMTIEAGQIYVVKYTLADGSVRTEYYLCDGTTWNGQLATWEITGG